MAARGVLRLATTGTLPPTAAPRLARAFSVRVSSEVCAPGATEPSESSRFAQCVAIGEGKHRILADEPPSVGGKDVGPSPYDLVLAALGACTNMTLRMYADSHRFPLLSSETSLAHSKVYAKDCQDCFDDSAAVTSGGNTKKIDRIERVIHLHGPDLTSAQRRRLLEIAEKCPVHRTLEASAVVKTRLAKEDGKADASEVIPEGT